MKNSFTGTTSTLSNNESNNERINYSPHYLDVFIEKKNKEGPQDLL